MNITRHARERWVERVNPTAGDDAEQQIRKAFQNAEYIYEDEKGHLHYINSDHWLFVVDEKNNTIITVIEIDYGLPSDVNKTVASMLLSKVREARIEAREVEKSVSDENQLIESEIVVVDAEIASIQAQLSTLEAKKKQLLGRKEEIQGEVLVAHRRVDELARKLVWSRNYKVDAMERRGA